LGLAVAPPWWGAVAALSELQSWCWFGAYAAEPGPTNDATSSSLTMCPLPTFPRGALTRRWDPDLVDWATMLYIHGGEAV